MSRRDSGAARLLTLALILFDLSAFNLTARNKMLTAGQGTDQLDRLLSCRGAAEFLKAQRGPFRVQVLADRAPNIGDVFRIETTWGGGATAPAHYVELVNSVVRATDLLNVRYFLKPAAAPEPGAVYQDAAWKVYENPGGYPRAWLVHEALVEPARKALLNRLDAPEIDPHRVALLGEPLEARLEPVSVSASEGIEFQSREADKLELTVHAASRGLLVLSEIYDPGWHATVNGKPERIFEVDGVLRGLIVGSGDNRITMRYLPGSFLKGAVLTVCALLGTALAWLVIAVTVRITRRIGREMPPWLRWLILAACISWSVPALVVIYTFVACTMQRVCIGS